MLDQKWPIIFNLIAAFLGAFGQYFYKIGAQKQNYWSLGAGVILFCGVMVLFVLAYRFGGRISVVYPFYATTFLWGALIGYFFEKEPLNVWMLVGIGFIFLGLSFLSSQIKG